MTANNLVLDVPPGIGLLGMAAEAEGYCVVNGPDLLWGRDMRGWHPIKGAFEGVIGGPPCQPFSSAAMNFQRLDKDMIPEWARIVSEAQPDWFLMENVRRSPVPIIEGYSNQVLLLNNRWLAQEDGTGPEQNRVRKFVFGTPSGLKLCIDSVTLVMASNIEWCVTATESGKGCPAHGPWSGRRKGRPIERQLELMGLPQDFFDNDHSPFTKEGKGRIIGNGVPLPMGRAVFKAVRKAMSPKG